MEKLKGTVLSEFRQYVMSEVSDPKALIDQVIVPYATAFAEIKEADYESSSGAEKVNELLCWLGQIDNADWLPSAILYHAKHSNDTAKLTTFLENLERLASPQLGLSWSSTLLAPHKLEGELAIRLTNWEFVGIVALNSGGEFGIRPFRNEGE